MSMRMNMLILMQPDIDKAIAFYLELGLKLVFRVPGKWAELSLSDGVRIGLCPKEAGAISIRTGDISNQASLNQDSINQDNLESDQDALEHRTGAVFEVPDVQKLYADMQDKIVFLNTPTSKPHGIIVSCKDPGGNIIDLYQPTPEKLQAEIQAQQAAQAAKEAACAASGGCSCAFRRKKAESADLI